MVKRPMPPWVPVDCTSPPWHLETELSSGQDSLVCVIPEMDLVANHLICSPLAFQMAPPGHLMIAH